MKIDNELDTGEIIFQKEIEKSWEDTGKSLYYKALLAMKSLLMEKRNEILNLDFNLIPQKGIGTYHWGYEIEESSQILLEQKYVARELINILRARTFRPFPAAYFIENGKKYEMTIKIEEVLKEFDKENIDYDEILQEYKDFDEKNLRKI